MILINNVSENRITLENSNSLFLPVIQSCMKRIQGRMATILINGEILISTTIHFISSFLLVSKDSKSLLHRTSRHEFLGSGHAMKRTIIINIINHSNIEHIGMEMRTFDHGSEHAILG